jgi:NAD(P)-dependent dehydrogenase (short-subunit alcohol dehydrogenase family)
MASQRHILITGVSRGLGLALTEEFIRLGQIVTGCARSVEAIDRLSSRFDQPHRFDVVDVRDDNQVAAWAGIVVGEERTPDLLLNNAAEIIDPAPLWETSAEDFARVMDTNVNGVFHVTRHFVPAMIKRGSGVIVNFSAAWGRTVVPQLGTLSTSKWAIEGLTRALAEELPYGLGAIPLDPGLVHTDRLDRCLGDRAADFATPDAWAKRVAPFLLDLSPDDNGDPLTAPTEG